MPVVFQTLFEFKFKKNKKKNTGQGCRILARPSLLHQPGALRGGPPLEGVADKQLSGAKRTWIQGRFVKRLAWERGEGFPLYDLILGRAVAILFELDYYVAVRKFPYLPPIYPNCRADFCPYG